MDGSGLAQRQLRHRSQFGWCVGVEFGMPGVTLLGRRWQAASDDFVIPASIDAIFRATWLVLICYVIYRLYPSWDCFAEDVADDEAWGGRNGIRAFLALCSILLLSEVVAAALLAGESSKGGIMDVQARRFVPSLLAFRLFLTCLELLWNVVGTVWLFGGHWPRCSTEPFANSIVEGLVLCQWGAFALTVLGIISIYDPMGSDEKRWERMRRRWHLQHGCGKEVVGAGERCGEEGKAGAAPPLEWEEADREIERQWHQLSSTTWRKRFRASLLCSWAGDSTGSREAFKEVSELFSSLLRGSRLVPSDIAAGLVLLRIREKKERRHKRLQEQEELDGECSRCIPGILPPPSPDHDTLNGNFAAVQSTKVVPDWMVLDWRVARYLRFAQSAYGWPYFMYLHCLTGLCRLLPYATCCVCLRSHLDHILDSCNKFNFLKLSVDDVANSLSPNIMDFIWKSFHKDTRRAKPTKVHEDNCCLCGLAALRVISKVPKEDILYVSFQNGYYQAPFVILLDHETSSLVIAIRGSLTIRDIFTDFCAASTDICYPDLPPGSAAHKGMLQTANYVKQKIEESGVFQSTLEAYPHYRLIITGHSLGAGVAALLALLMKPSFPSLRCYSFSPPAGLLSREAARYTESFVLTVGLGHDLVMRLGVDTIEDLRTRLLDTIYKCTMPKYRILTSGCSYPFMGIPSKALGDQIWRRMDYESEVKVPEKKNVKEVIPGKHIPLPSFHGPPTSPEAAILDREIGRRRFSTQRLYSPGRILHLMYKKRNRENRNDRRVGPRFEAFWRQPEHFLQLEVMPRMVLDHLPEKILDAVNDVLLHHNEPGQTT